MAVLLGKIRTWSSAKIQSSRGPTDPAPTKVLDAPDNAPGVGSKVASEPTTKHLSRSKVASDTLRDKTSLHAWERPFWLTYFLAAFDLQEYLFQAWHGMAWHGGSVR